MTDNTNVPTFENPGTFIQSQHNHEGWACSAIVDGQLCMDTAHYWYGGNQGIQHRCHTHYIQELDARGIINMPCYVEATHSYHVGERYEMPPHPGTRHHPVWTLVRITPPDPRYPDGQAALYFESDILRRDGTGPIPQSIGSRDMLNSGMRLTERLPSPIQAGSPE